MLEQITRFSHVQAVVITTCGCFSRRPFSCSIRKVTPKWHFFSSGNRKLKATAREKPKGSHLDDITNLCTLRIETLKGNFVVYHGRYKGWAKFSYAFDIGPVVSKS